MRDELFLFLGGSPLGRERLIWIASPAGLKSAVVGWSSARFASRLADYSQLVGLLANDTYRIVISREILPTHSSTINMICSIYYLVIDTTLRI